MDNVKVGGLIRALRLEKRMTQKQLADKLSVSDKAVSKWERGLGCPDVSLLSELSAFFGVAAEKILDGELATNETVGGNMKNSKYYVCSTCGNLILCTGNAEISCCGRTLNPLEAVKADEEQRLAVERIEDDWYITSNHPMTKENYISFIAFATGNTISIFKQYPEWTCSARIPVRGHGTLLWYAESDGLRYQYL